MEPVNATADTGEGPRVADRRSGGRCHARPMEVEGVELSCALGLGSHPGSTMRWGGHWELS
jgi:hypothetical protein